ncbi:hydantoinase/oxoprolinase family protein [Conexibacter sp. SYSU D00693]|uniref:hydantoinase/oxoprolinase family protein n=1 Tax=Conexibacter sp. SYSU D00693 TaxID=2812560 RepID=UPI00196BB16E|nr:hydantoinase/oxoprolinase family protein [Conexibacter sp. SYSU D00693]
MEINVDIGGTFTDCFATDGGRVAAAKALTTHHDLSDGFMTALGDLATELGTSEDDLLGRTQAIRYATTLGTNALIERSGPRLGLLTTTGFEDVVPIGRCRAYGEGLSHHEARNLARAQRPEPLIPRDHIVGLRERVDHAGNVVMPLDPDEVREAVGELVDRGVRGFVVSLLWSFKNPEHELLVREVIEEEYPSCFLGRFPVILAHEVSSRAGEYVRSMTSILDAYLHRFTADRMSELRNELRDRGYGGSLMLVHNSGGMGGLARTTPLQTIHAGPVAGLYGSRHLAERFDLGKVVTTDMGGTSFDIGVVVEGSVRFYEFNPVIDRWLVQMPMMDIKAVGAGGGSIAAFDEFRGVTVGPRSAGSMPGPACYAQGGTEPTVTDANLVLGYLDPDGYHGGSMQLDVRRAERAIERRVARPMGVDVTEAARSIRAVVDNQMGDAIFKEIVLKGYDPRGFTIFSFGGGGPLHACGYAEVLQIPRVVVPPHAPVFSASGAAGLDLLHIYERSEHVVLLNPLFKTVLEDAAPINDVVDEFMAQARDDFADEGHAPEDVEFALELDVRSGGQLYLTTISSPVLRIESQADLADVLQAYFTEYADRFGEFAVTKEVGASVETIRLRASVRRRRWELAELPAPTHDVDAARKGQRDCWWPRAGFEPTPVYDHDLLGPGHRVEGPAVLEGRDTTVVVAPGWSAAMDRHGFLMLTKEETA